MEYKKNNNAITINVNDDIKKEIEMLASYYQRKPAELLRLLLVPTLRNEWAKIQRLEHPENAEPLTVARFNK